MSMHFADIARQAAADGAITAEEILDLRRAGWVEGAMSADEVEAIFTLNDALPVPTAEWSDFFVEAIGEYVINGTAPKGYVSEADAAWLVARIGRDGQVQGLTELELLVRVLERSLNVPETLKAYVLEQVERAVLTGSGATRRGSGLGPGHVNAAEAEIVRRVLFAPAGDAPAAVSCAEAEMLFRLKDATRGAANALEWKQLFIQGVANYLQGVASRTAQISREQAAELESFMADDSTHVARFVGRMVASAPDVFSVVFGSKQPQRDRLAELRAAEELTADERRWLDTHVDADGEIDGYEQALIAFLAATSAQSNSSAAAAPPASGFGPRGGSTSAGMLPSPGRRGLGLLFLDTRATSRAKCARKRTSRTQRSTSPRKASIVLRISKISRSMS